MGHIISDERIDTCFQIFLSQWVQNTSIETVFLAKFEKQIWIKLKIFKHHFVRPSLFSRLRLRFPRIFAPLAAYHRLLLLQRRSDAIHAIVFFASVTTSSQCRHSILLFYSTVNRCLLSLLLLAARTSQRLQERTRKSTSMTGQAAKSVAKTIGGYQYPWREKLAKHSSELSKGVWGYWHLGAWKPLGISARHRAKIRREVLLAGQDWPYDPARKEMRTKRKGHKVDRIAAEKRENTAKLMVKMPQMLLDYKKRVWEKRMKEEEKNKS